MRYLNKIIFLNSAHVPYSEIKLDGNVHFIGTQGVGKSTLLRAILFFYNADKLKLGIPKEKKGFDAFYFPYDNSYIVYEVMRENGAYCVLVSRAMKRAVFRFIDAPYSREWFLNERNEVIADWIEIRKRIPANCLISPLINEYSTFRDIIFGNNKKNDLIPYRKYAIVESANYQNIPRTIQNVFLNSKLDADFIKDTIIKSMNEDDIAIDLTVYRSLIDNFEQEYNDVMLWLKPNKNGVVEVRKQADNVIKKYRALLLLKRQIKQEREELNYAEKASNLYLPVLKEKIDELQEKLNRYIRLLAEEDEKFRKEHDRLKKDEGVFEDKLKTSRQKRKEYDQQNITEIIARVNKEQEANVELESVAQRLNKLTSLYKDIIEKYQGLMKQVDVEFKDFENLKKEESLKVRVTFEEEKSVLNQKKLEREKSERDRSETYRDNLHDTILDCNNEQSELKGQLQKVKMTLHFKDEIEQRETDRKRIKDEEGKLRLEIEQCKLSVNKIRQDANGEIKEVEGKYDAQINALKHKQEVLDKENSKLCHLRDQQKGSFGEWLDENKPDWRRTIGKVVDEESILYNQDLKPQIDSGSSQNLFGVKVDLSSVSREVRTPKNIQEELDENNVEQSKLALQVEKLVKEKAESCDSIRTKANKKIREVTDEQHLLEATLEHMPSQLKSLQVEIADWRQKEDEWKQKETERLNILLGKKEDMRRQLKNQLEQSKVDLHKKLEQISEELGKLIRERESKRDDVIAQINKQLDEKRKEAEAKKSELRISQTNELDGKGADTSVIKNYEMQIEALKRELNFIRDNRHYVIEYKKDKREYFDLEMEFQNSKKEIGRQLADLKDKYEQRAVRLRNSKNGIKSELDFKNNEFVTIKKDQEELCKFREDDFLCPPESATIAERVTKDTCGQLIGKLKIDIVRSNSENDGFKKAVNAFSGNFTTKNTFSFPTTLVTDADYLNYAANVCEFVEENKIDVYQTRISERYSNIIRRISKEIGDLTKNEGEIHKTINAINDDFVERNFTGVIRSIELRAQPTNDKLMQLLLEMKRFNEENPFNMGQVNLFSQESRSDVNAKAVRYLNSLSVKLNDEAGRKNIVLSDTFNLQFRIIENDNDTGWIEKIANVGSDGTDILVKAMVNIMLINVFKEKASRKFGDFKLHCMMDEIGKLHPTNVKGILSFANCRNILLINSSPTTYNVEDYRYTYLLRKDAKSNTKVIPLLTRK